MRLHKYTSPHPEARLRGTISAANGLYCKADSKASMQPSGSSIPPINGGRSRIRFAHDLAGIAGQADSLARRVCAVGTGLCARAHRQRRIAGPIDEVPRG